ncbi:MAG: transglycosylase domain-containing protein [Candidatus Pacebacteria bacterium]|nr:transglycosylase domain-containing protein [Candidatus Paceibacterota bacterium]
MRVKHHFKNIKHKIKKLRAKIPKNFFILLAGIFIFLIAFIIIYFFSLNIPDFQSFQDRKVANSTKIYDRTGEILLYNIHQDAKRTDISFDKMGSNIKNATIAIEDAEFYNHNGVRITSTIRAVLSNIFNVGIGGGGSTITQQLVKNTLLTQKKTYTRKIKEWILAIKLDKAMPKDKILEYYLNEAPYGGNIYGVEEASRTYFNKNAKDLSLAEGAYLASIPQSPTALSPYGKNRNKLDERKNLVLSRMYSLRMISEEEYIKAKEEVIVFTPQVIGGIKAPHFVFFIKNYLEEKYGIDVVEQGGLKVTTTLDYTLQEEAEKIVKEGALKNQKDWNGENASLVAIDPKTGQILTMVGSRDYFDKEIDGNFNVATGLRQPGSAFKPFIYATAFNKGFTPDTILFDLPTEFNASCGPYGGTKDTCYMPQNYDGNFRGPISLRNALAQSINVPAVKLFYLSGLRDSLKTAEDMGISTLTDISRYGLTLVIGGGEVTLLDITSAYGVFANSGIKNPYTGILKIENTEGKILEEFTPKEKEVLPKNTTLIISDILSDNVSRAPTFGSNSVLNVKNTAVKTGTTNSNKDAWTIGYSPNIVVGVWAGNNDNRPMKKGGSALAGPIWNKFINFALNKVPSESFEQANLYFDADTVKPILRGSWMGNENFFIDKISQKLATINTPKETRQEKIITNVHTILYWINKNDILGAQPSNPQSDSQFNNWEVPIQDWWEKNKYKYSIITTNQIPTEEDNIHTETLKPSINILEPNEVSEYPIDQKINLQISNNSPLPLKKIDIFINDIYIDSIDYPFSFSFIPKDIENVLSQNKITIIGYDTAYNRGESTGFFNVK